MKKILLLLITGILFVPLPAVKDWEIHTNTTHLFDAYELNGIVYIASWGGLSRLDRQTGEFLQPYTTVDGLSNNEIRTLDYFPDNDELLLGSGRQGIDRFQNGNFLIPLNDVLGLASNNVRQICHLDTLILAATDQGLSIFTKFGDFPFPFLLNNFTIDNGLSSNMITSLAVTSDGWIFCGSSNGIDYIHADSLNQIDAWQNLNDNNSPLPSSQINSLSINNGKLAAGTHEGIGIVEIADLNEWQIFYPSDLNGRHSVFPVLLDDEDNLWFSYGFWEESQLTVIDTTQILLAKIDLGNSLLEEWSYSDLGSTTNKVTSIKIFEDGALGILTWGEGMILISDSVSQIYKENSPGASLVQGVFVDRNETAWVSSGYQPPSTTPPLPRGTAGVSGLQNGVWEVFRVENSPILSNNIFSLAEDVIGRKWFGAWWVNSQANQEWDDGISIYDQDDGTWKYLTSSDGLLNNCITYITQDNQGRMWVSCNGGSNGGVSIIDQNDEVVHSFQYPTVENTNDAILIYFGETRYYFGGIVTGLRIWNNTTIPETNGLYWQEAGFNELKSGRIYSITSHVRNGREEIWVASANGLFQYRWTTYFNGNGEYLWFKYGTTIKRQAYRNNQWLGSDIENPEFWYIEGQERLYGSVPTFPTTLFLDPFDRLWIGTQDNGITVYNIYQDTYTIINSENSALISDKINDFAYNENTGRLFIATDEGLQSFLIGISPEFNREDEIFQVKVFPNPFSPELDGVIRFINHPSQTMPSGDTRCYIYDLAGDLVIELKKDIFEEFTWDGLNKADKKCSSGIYYYLISDGKGQTALGKFALIR